MDLIQIQLNGSKITQLNIAINLFKELNLPRDHFVWL